MLRTILPRRIIRLRELLGLTQKRLAERAGIATSTLCDIESGLAKDLKVSTLMLLATHLHSTPNFLLGLDSPTVAGKCSRCLHIIREGHVHTQGECIMLTHERGVSSEMIAIERGLTVESIDAIVRSEYSVRRRRRVPQVLSAS